LEGSKGRILLQGVRNLWRCCDLKVTSAVVHEEAQPFVEALELEEPRADEVLVRVVATGMCHTDVIVRDQ
jgi:hypothetical protein